MFVVYVDDKKAERQISEIRKKYREFVDAINDLRFDSECEVLRPNATRLRSELPASTTVAPRLRLT